MYLVECRSCRTQYSNESRICPHCGRMPRRITAVPHNGPEAHTERGEAFWDKSTE